LTHETFDIFSLCCPAEEVSDRAALVSTWHPARINPVQAQMRVEERGRKRDPEASV